MRNTRHCSANVTEAVFYLYVPKNNPEFYFFYALQVEDPSRLDTAYWRQSEKRTRDVYAGRAIVFKRICLFRNLVYFKEQFAELLRDESSVEKSYCSFIV